MCRDTNTHPEPRSDERNGGIDRGLCVTCLHLEACERPKPEGGVWHCERYEENPQAPRDAVGLMDVEDEGADESGTTGEHA